MKKTKSVLIIGPFPEPTTGVSLANKVVFDILEEQPDCVVHSINTSYSRFDEALGQFSLHKLLFNLAFYFKTYKVFSNQLIYITPGQTFFGLMKYAGFILLSSLLGKEIVIHVHGNHLGSAYNSLKRWKKKIFHFLLSKTTTGIVLSASLKNNMTPFITPDRVTVIHNFAQDYIAHPAENKCFDKLQIIYLSNLMEEKGIFDLLQALQLLETKHIPYEARIAGAVDIAQKDKIETALTTLEHTTYLGIVKGKEKKNLLDWGNVFVLPTYYKMEGQPISILEALATGNVILTTRHAGIPDIITDGVHGSFFEKKNPLSLFNALSTLNDRKEQIIKISTYNQRYFSENFTRLRFKENILKILLKKP